MADKVYQLPYDDEIDKDIAEWLSGLPRSRKAEIVRHAIRMYIATTQGASQITVSHISNSSSAENAAPVPAKKRPKTLPTNGDF